jgi:hypothetical protein
MDEISGVGQGGMSTSEEWPDKEWPEMLAMLPFLAPVLFNTFFISLSLLSLLSLAVGMVFLSKSSRVD